MIGKWLTLTAGTDPIETVSEVTDHQISENALHRFFKNLPDQAMQFAIQVAVTLLVVLVALRLIRMLVSVVKKSLDKTQMDAGMSGFLCSFLSAALKVLLLFGVLSSFGVNSASIVALLGSAGVAIGLALQGGLSNLIGGLIILILKPFVVGDYISEDSHSHEGTVQEIGLFYTQLYTYDQKVVVLPNGDLANTGVINMTKQPRRMLEMKVGVSYDADIDQTKQVLRKVMEELPESLKQEPFLVFVDSLQDSSVVFGLRCFVKTSDYFRAKCDLTEQVKKALDLAGIEIPYPQMDLHQR